MEELKMLVDMVAKLPAMALWVLVGFWAYKVIVVGSVYGVIRLAINKLHSALTKQDVQVRLMLDGECISGTKEGLMAQLGRIKTRKEGAWCSSYIHQSDVDWLREAISEKLERDGK